MQGLLIDVLRHVPSPAKQWALSGPARGCETAAAFGSRVGALMLMR